MPWCFVQTERTRARRLNGFFRKCVRGEVSLQLEKGVGGGGKAWQGGSKPGGVLSTRSPHGDRRDALLFAGGKNLKESRKREDQGPGEARWGVGPYMTYGRTTWGHENRLSTMTIVMSAFRRLPAITLQGFLKSGLEPASPIPSLSACFSLLDLVPVSSTRPSPSFS